MKFRQDFRLVFAAMLTLGATQAAVGAEEGSASFFDDFSELDRDRWRISDGWVNGNHQNCTWSASQVALSNGILSLSFEEQSNHLREYACGEVFTHDRFGYGTFEARFRTETGSGLNAAFFSYIGPANESPHDEIDFEVLTRDTAKVSLNTYVDGEPANGAVVPVAEGADAAFNHYAFEWGPERIRWFINGTLVHEATEPLPTNAQRIYFSLWGTDTLTAWMGVLDYPGEPVSMHVDWVAYSAPGTKCAFPQSITCRDAD